MEGPDGSGKSNARSPWVYVGFGCLGALLLGGILLVGAFYFVGKKIETLSEDIRDPARRTERATQILATKKLPPGYQVALALSVPLVMDTVILSDVAPDEQGQTQDRASRLFMYFRARNDPANHTNFNDFLEGRADTAETLEQMNLRPGEAKAIARGRFDIGPAVHRYVAFRGQLDAAGRGDFDQALGRNAISGFVSIECPGDDGKLLRMGLWVVKDPNPETPTEALELTDTPGHEDSLKAFFGHFGLCPR